MVVFRRRVVHHVGLAVFAIAGSVVMGTLGYHVFGRQDWIDAFENASMLLGGMGQVGDVPSFGGKVFASLFALYAGLLFIAVAGLVLAPFLHRVLHRFHLDR